MPNALQILLMSFARTIVYCEFIRKSVSQRGIMPIASSTLHMSSVMTIDYSVFHRQSMSQGLLTLLLAEENLKEAECLIAQSESRLYPNLALALNQSCKRRLKI